MTLVPSAAERGVICARRTIHHSGGGERDSFRQALSVEGQTMLTKWAAKEVKARHASRSMRCRAQPRERGCARYRLVANGVGDVDLEKLDAAELEPALRNDRQRKKEIRLCEKHTERYE
eukprot:1601815-Pleurochrysis_carterae.AAC.9